MDPTIQALSARKVRLGVTLDGNDAQMIEQVMPLVDVVEVTPDRWATSGSGRPAQVTAKEMEVLSAIARERTLIVHGVGLSLASHDSWNGVYLRILDQMFDHPLPIAWHSEHLAFSRVDGESLGAMVEPPWTYEAMNLIAYRICALQERYGVPFLIEHVVRAFPRGDESEMSTAEFLNGLLRRTGCGLLLDIYNLECDEYNFAADPLQLLDALDLSAVREIHVAGGTMHEGHMTGIQSRVLADSTLQLLRRTLRLARRADVVVFEVLKEAVPNMGLAVLTQELKRLRRALDAPV